MWCVLLAADGEEEEGGDEDEVLAEVEEEEEVDEDEEFDGGNIGKMCFIPVDWFDPGVILSLPVVLTAYKPGVSENWSFHFQEALSIQIIVIIIIIIIIIFKLIIIN